MHLVRDALPRPDDRRGVTAVAGRRVVVLVCGEPERGDDAAAFRAVELPAIAGLDGIEVRTCGALDVEDLLAVGPDEACLIVDAAVGVPAGRIVDGTLASLVSSGESQGGGPGPRSTHVLSVGDALALAAILRPGLPPGAFVGIGGASFELGEGLSPAVRPALPSFADAIAATIGRLAAS